MSYLMKFFNKKQQTDEMLRLQTEFQQQQAENDERLKEMQQVVLQLQVELERVQQTKGFVEQQMQGVSETNALLHQKLTESQVVKGEIAGNLITEQMKYQQLVTTYEEVVEELTSVKQQLLEEIHSVAELKKGQIQIEAVQSELAHLKEAHAAELVVAREAGASEQKELAEVNANLKAELADKQRVEAAEVKQLSEMNEALKEELSRLAEIREAELLTQKELAEVNANLKAELADKQRVEADIFRRLEASEAKVAKQNQQLNVMRSQLKAPLYAQLATVLGQVHQQKSVVQLAVEREQQVAALQKAREEITSLIQLPKKQEASAVGALSVQQKSVVWETTEEPVTVDFQEVIEETIEAVIRDVEEPELVYFERTDVFEREHFEKVTAEIKADMPQNIPSRYQVSQYMEDGWHSGRDFIRSIQSKLELKGQLEKQLEQPYFARMDVYEAAEQKGTTFYVGLEMINDYIVSWKAPIAEIFYEKAVGTEKLYSTGKARLDYTRDFEVRNGQLISLGWAQTSASDMQSQLVASLEAKRGQDMSIIVETIQKEQYDLIRLPIQQSVIIQGSAGSGKSAIALHRLSYILYKYTNLTASSIAIFGPNEIFLHHIRKVLPKLGDHNVLQTTFVKYGAALLGMTEDQLKRYDGPNHLAVQTQKGGLLYIEKIYQAIATEINDLAPFLKPYIMNTNLGDIVVTPFTLTQQLEKHQHLAFAERRNAYINTLLTLAQQRLTALEQLYVEEQSAVKNVVARWAMQLEDMTPFQQEPDGILTPRLQQIFGRWQEAEQLKTLQANEEGMIERQNKIIDECRKEANQEIMVWRQHQLAIIEMSVAEQMEKEFAPFSEALLKTLWKKARQPVIQQHFETIVIQQLHSNGLLQQPIYDVGALIEQEAVGVIIAEITEAITHEEEDLYAQFSAPIRARVEHVLGEKLKVQLEKKWAEQVELYVNRHFKLNVFVHPTLTEPVSLSIAHERLNQHVKQFIEPYFDKDAFDFVEQYLQQEPLLKKAYAAVKTRAKRSWITIEDLPALLLVEQYLKGASFVKPLSYLIVDEAQDYMPLEIAAMKSMTKADGLMLIGDIGQNLQEASDLVDWQQLTPILHNFMYFELSATYRSTEEIVQASNAIIEPFSCDKYALSTITYRNGSPVLWQKIVIATKERVIEAQVERYLTHKANYSSVAIITKTSEEAEQLVRALNVLKPISVLQAKSIDTTPIVVTTAKDAKGLEFDCVIIANLSDYMDTDYDRKLAYVAMSRALHELCVLYSEESSLLPIER